jgi:hypothetical protein
VTDCPLCTGWCGELDTQLRRDDMCLGHAVFMDRLDAIIDENREVLGRLSEQDKIQFGQSLEQLRRREGRVVHRVELEGDKDV